MSVPAKVKKWGNSMAVLIPGHFAQARHIGVGSVVDLEDVRVVQPKRRRYRLAQLVAKYKRRHRHGQWDLGSPVGKEIW